MDENTNQQPTTPLGNERSLTPGQDNIASNNLPTLPNIDENTPLNDITKQYTDIGTAHAGLVENAADNVGDRQVQLVGNDFGATNPYMFNTYYEPASTSFASEMRKQGTQRAVEVGLERAEEEARKNAENAQKRYNNAVAAAKQRQQEAAAARAHISETDSSKMPQGTNEREVLNSEAFKKMNDKEREDALTAARIADMQAKQGNGGVTDWNIKEQRKKATSATKQKFGVSDDKWNKMSKEEKDAFWARTDVGNYWTEQYMIADFKRRGDGGMMVESFNDIHSDVRAIVKAVKDSTVSKLDQHVFETLVPVASPVDVKDWKFDNIKKSIENSNLDQARKDEYIAAMNAIGKDQFERLWKGYANKDLDIGDDGMLKHAGSTIGYNGLNGKNNPKYTYNGKSESVGFAIKAIYNSFAGNVDNIENMSAADWVGSVNYIDNISFTSPQTGLTTDQMADELFTNAFGVDWSSISALAKLQEEHPDDFNYLLNQSSYILASGGAPFDVIDDPNKKYYVDGKYWSVNDENSPLKMGDLVFYSVDLPKNDKGEYADEDLNRFIELYSDIYTGKKEATDENKEALNKYYSSYQTSLAAAMAASARQGTRVDENIYSSILSMRDGADLSKLRIANPSKPEETISLDELIAWFNSFNEDAQYNGYTALVNRTRGLKGRYYIYNDDLKGVTSVPERQNGVNTIGKYGKTSGSKNMEMANQVANLSDDQCLALNLFLDSQMKSGKIKTNFFDNDEISLGDSLANQMLNSARGTATMIGAAGTFMWGFLTGQDKVISEAGKIWDEMTTLDQFDNMSWAGNSSRTDATLFNNYTEDVRRNQRSNLNHLIDTTFNIDYFDPNNTYDEATGEVKNSKGEVISYTDNSYFHKDDWKGFTDTMAGTAGFIVESIMEYLATAGIGNMIHAGKLALEGTTAGVKLSQAKNVLANYLTSAPTIGSIKQAHRLNQANAFVRKASEVLGSPIMTSYLINNINDLSKITEGMAKEVAASVIKSRAKEAAKSAAEGAVASFGDDAVKLGEKATQVIGDSADDAIDELAKAYAVETNDFTNDFLKLYVDDIATGEEKAIAQNALDTLTQYKNLSDTLAPGLEEAAKTYKTQFAIDRMYMSIADDVDGVARTVAQKLSKYISSQIDNLNFGKMLGRGASGVIDDITYDGIKRAAVNVSLSEATGISVERIMSLEDDTARLLYDVMQSTRGSNKLVTNDITKYISSRNFYSLSDDVSRGTINFKKAAEQLVSASETAQRANKVLSIDDALRIMSRNSSEKGKLISTLRRSEFWRDRIADYSRDIMQGYYNPHLDEHFNSDYTSIEEYVTDPTQWLMGSVFDLGMSGARKAISSIKLSSVNRKLDKLVSEIDTSKGVENDSALLAKNLRKMNSLKLEADRLTNKVFDGGISYNKVHSATTNIEKQINNKLDEITNHFDLTKSLDFMSENIKQAAKDSTALDRFKAFTGFGQTKVMSATEVNRMLIRSDDTLKSFIYANDALKAKFTARFADMVNSCPNAKKLTSKQYKDAFINAWDNTIGTTDFAKQFGANSLVKRKDGKYTNTINISDKAKAKELFARGQEIVWNAFYDELAKMKSQLDGVVDFRSLKAELNGLRDRIVEVGYEMIDNGQPVRWNYFPAQGLMFEGAKDTPVALTGFYYGAGEHTSLMSNITDPTRQRDTMDMAQIVSDIKSGKTEYQRELSFNEKLRAKNRGEPEVEFKSVPYNEDGFNPLYAVTAYLNTYDSKKFAAPYLDPMRNGNIVIADDGILNIRMGNETAAKSIEAAKYYNNLKEGYSKTVSAKMTYSDVESSIKDAKGIILGKDSKEIAKNRAKINSQKTKLRKTISNSDQFKSIANYMDINNPTNAQIAERLQSRFSTMTSDIKAVASGAKDKLSDLYNNSNSVQYRSVIDGLAKNKTALKDLNQLDGRTINFGDVDLNYSVFNKRYYGVIGIMESTQRAIDNINASKKLSPELTLDELEFMSRQNAVLSQMDNVNTTNVINESVQAGTFEAPKAELATIKFSHLDDKRPDDLRVVLMDDSKTVNKYKSTDGNILHTMARNKGDGTIELHPKKFMEHYENVKSGKSGWNMDSTKKAKDVVAEVSKSPEDMLTWTLLHERGHDAPGGYGANLKYSGEGGKEAAANNWAYEKFFDKTSPDYIAAHDAAVKILGNMNTNPTKSDRMDFSYGKNAQPHISEKTTFEAVKSGKRTSTTRLASQHADYWQDLKVGDIVEFKNKGNTDSVLVRVTKAPEWIDPTKMSDAELESLLQKEGWKKKAFDELITDKVKAGDKALQFEYELVNKSTQSTTISAPRYSVEDFVRIREINESSKADITSTIYNMMLNKYGDKEFKGAKTFSSSNVKKTINQFAYDAYDTIALDKVSGEGITLAEVVERFNDTFPNAELFFEKGNLESYNTLSSKISSYQNAGGDLNTLKQDIADTLRRVNDGEIKLTPEQTRRFAAAYYDLDEASFNSERLTNRGRSELSIDNKVDDEGATFESTIASSADYAKDPAKIMSENADTTPTREGLNISIDVNADRSAIGKINNLNYVMDLMARRKTDYKTRITANKKTWAVFNDVIKPNYESVVNGINAQLPKGKKLNIAKVVDNSSKMSDSNWLRITRQFDNGVESFSIGNKIYSRQEVAEMIKNGIDGRGTIKSMNPDKLRKYIADNKLKITEPMATALATLDKTYKDFAEDFLDATNRRTVSGTLVSPKDAVNNILSSSLDVNNRPLNFDASLLASVSDAPYSSPRTNSAMKFPDADGNVAEVNIVYDYGTGSEGTTGTASYWYEKTTADGDVVRYDTEEELAASLAPNVSADDIRFAMNDAGYDLNIGEKMEPVTDWFYHGDRSTRRGIDNVGPDYEDWQIDNANVGSAKMSNKTSSSDARRINAEIKKLGDVTPLTAEEERMYKQIISSKFPYDNLSAEYKAVYDKAKRIEQYNRLLAAKRASAAKAISAGTNPMLDFVESTYAYNNTKSSIEIENALYGKDGKPGYIDTVNNLTRDNARMKLKRDSDYYEATADIIAGLREMDGSPEMKASIISALENVKSDFRKSNAGDISDDIDKLIDETIYQLDKKYANRDELVEELIQNNPTYKAMMENIEAGKNMKRGAGQTIISIDNNGPIIVNSDADVSGKISIKQLRESRELVAMKKDNKTIIGDVVNSRKDKKILKSMRDGFTDGYSKKQLVGEATMNRQNKWIDNLVEAIKEKTGAVEIDESKVYINKTVASLGQSFFGEGTAGWQEKAYKLATSLSEFNKLMQDIHLAGGVGQYNAFTLRNALTMLWQDPIGGTRALFTNFRNARDNDSVVKFFINNSEKLLKYAMDSGDFSTINKFAPMFTMRDETVGKGFFTSAIESVMDIPSTIAESESKLAGFGKAMRNVYAEMFNNPTFARWTLIADADLRMRNYDKAKKYVDRIARSFNLTDEDFETMDGGIWQSKDAYIANLARLRTEMFWRPKDFVKSKFNAKKFLAVEEAANNKRTVEVLRSMPKKTTAADAFRNFFFAMNYKLQMNMHPIHGFGSVAASIYNVPRVNMQLASKQSLNLAASRFAGGGNRNEAITLIGIAALAHAWNTYIGAPSAWSQLWEDDERAKQGKFSGISKSLQNFQDFFKVWLPDQKTGKFNPQNANSLDPAFSIFTLQNSGARALNALINPNAAHISPQRNDFGLQNLQIGDWKFGRGVEGAMDEFVGANLLAGYKAAYEVLNNNTYFGNNIWEQPYLPDGSENPNYDPGRNFMASIAHILNLDGAIEGNGLTGAGSNRWVKGLDIDSIYWENGQQLDTPKTKGLKIGKKGKWQDKTGTVSGSGLIQHEYTTALAAINDGDYFEALSGAMELPFKSRSYTARARTSLNQEVSMALRDAKKEYERDIEGASVEEKDKAFAKFASKAVEIVHDWSHEYGDVLGKNDELTATATKILMAFMSDEYDDDLMYMQNMYVKLKQELRMADGDQFIFSKKAAEEAIADGMSPEEAAEKWNKHLTALKEAQMKEYKARLALEEAGINDGLDTSVFDSTDFMYDKMSAESATISKKIYTEIKGKLESPVGEFKNFKEMKSYYEGLIDEASSTKQKAKLAEKYNDYVTDVISPYVEEYGGAIFNDAYWDGDNMSNHFGKYIIIPADQYYSGKSPRANYLKNKLGIGWANAKHPEYNENLPSDKEVKENLNKVANALAKGQVSSAKALVDNALLQLRKGYVHAAPVDYDKLIRMRALLSSRSK